LVQPSDRPLANDATSWLEEIISKQPEDDDGVKPPALNPLPCLDDSKLQSLEIPKNKAEEGESEDDDVSGECVVTKLTREISERVIIERGKSVRLQRMSSVEEVEEVNKTESDIICEETETEKEKEKEEEGSVTSSSTRDSFTNTVVAGPAKLKMGWLFKRNRHGFRNWKKRWFVLKSTGSESELSWYSSHEEVFNGVTWGDPHGKISLRNCTLTDLRKGFR